MGITTPTWTSPGIWPTKEGETAITLQPKTSQLLCNRHLWKRLHGGRPLLSGRSSPEKFLYGRGALPSPFWQPLMEVTKYAPSTMAGHANSHIQQNTVEKTTAPTVMDCIQAIHWLNTAKEGSTPAVAQGTDTGWTYPQKITTWAILKAATDESRSPRRGGDFK